MNLRRSTGTWVASIYLAVTAFGAICMALLPVTEDGPMGALDAVFTSTSAVTLTGLTVVDTPTLNMLGQIIIFALIAFGAAGVAAATVGLVVVLGRASWEGRQVVSADVGSTGTDQKPFLIFVTTSIVVAVALGGGVLRTTGLTWWESWFHALSGFANAGFSTLDQSLGGVSNTAVAAICALVLVGGLGYPVTFEIVRRVRHRTRTQWSYTTHLTLLVTAALLAISGAIFALFEWNNEATLGDLPLARRLTALTTLVVMPRSGGFDLTGTSDLTDGSVLSTIALMFVGAGPAATGGGLKTTGTAVLLIALIAACKGRTETQVGRFNIAPRVVGHAVAVAACLIATILALALVLAVNTDASTALFNATSAVTTTGLSIGAAASTGIEKVAVSAAMLIGRLAPMLLAVRLASSHPAHIRQIAKPVLIT